jgi:hypothetical protein
VIIREGINVRYSHDEEALLSHLIGLPEFSGVSLETLTEWVSQLRPYSYNKEYYTIEEDGEFWSFSPTTHFQYVTAEVRARLVKVSLWNLDETEIGLLRQNGFSCLTCRKRTPWNDRPTYPLSGALWNIVGHRASPPLPALVCPKCASFLAQIFSHTHRTPEMIDAAVGRMLCHYLADASTA